MHRRFLRHAALIGLVGIIAAGCGGSDGNATSAGGDKPSNRTDNAKVDSEVDRSSRFAGLDSFCEPTDEKPSEKPKATGDGITADEIVVTHVRSTLEELEKLGFAVPIGDTKDQVERFTDLINDRCGGINGRKLKLDLVEYPVIPKEDPAALAQRKCIEITEDQKAAIAVSPSGQGGLLTSCLTADHDTVFLSTVQLPTDEIEAAGNRLYGFSISTTDSLKQMVLALADSGALKGKTVGVVFQDNTNQPQIVERGFLDVMKDQGIDVKRADVLKCEGNTCNGGLQQSVSGIIADGVDVLFPLLSILNLPSYMAELATQGVKPGDMTVYNSAFNAQDSDLASSKVAAFGGDAAAALYDGATLYSGAPSGVFRTEGYKPSKFMEMCNREYVEAGGEKFDLFEQKTSTAYLMVGTVCSMMRVVARAVEAAGVNPTRSDIGDAFENLGGIDMNFEVPSSFHPGDHTAPDAIYELTFHYPCSAPMPTDANTCLTSKESARVIDRD